MNDKIETIRDRLNVVVALGNGGRDNHVLACAVLNLDDRLTALERQGDQGLHADLVRDGITFDGDDIHEYVMISKAELEESFQQWAKDPLACSNLVNGMWDYLTRKRSNVDEQ